jgi:hypothetical protein
MIKIMPDKIFSAATYCTSGGLICTGLARAYDWFHGLDWNFIALISGILIGAATYFTNLYFKRRWTKAMRKRFLPGNSYRHRRMINHGLKNKTQRRCVGACSCWCFCPTILDQFLNEKEGNSLTAYRDGAGIWTICRGATLVDGKPVRQGMKLTQEKCDQVNAKNAMRRWRGWIKTSM